MRIGILVDIDNKTILPFLKQKDRLEVAQACHDSCAPSVNTLILSLIKAGHYVRIFALAKKKIHVKSELVEIFTETPYDIYPIKYLWGIFYTAKRLSNLVKTHIEDLDVLHAHWTYTYAYAAIPFQNKIPVFCTVRDWPSVIFKAESWKNKISWIAKYFMSEIVYKQPSINFIGNSPYTAKLVAAKINKQVPIIPNSIKDSFVRKDETDNNNKSKTVLCISSSNDKRKNVKSLLLAFRLFNQRFPETKLTLVGPPFVSGEPVIEKWKKEELLHNVDLIGPVSHSELITYLDNAMMFVAPSKEETFGNTLLESIVRNCPIIGGKNSGAVPYVLHEGRAGYLCDVNSPEDIFNMMSYVYTHPKERLDKAKIAKQIILSEYSESKVCTMHIQLYNKYVDICSLNK